MRILVVTQYFWPENFRVNDLVSALRERGHAVEVLTGMPNYPTGKFFKGYGWLMPREERWQGVRIVRCPLIPRGKGQGARLALNFLSFALSASLRGPMALHGRFDAIFVYEVSPITVAIPAILLGRLRRTPVFLWVLDLWPESVTSAGDIRSPAVLKPIAWLVRKIYRHCDQILVQSRGFIDRVKAHGTPAEKIRYWPGWAEQEFAAEKPVANVVPLPDGFRVVFAGNLGAAQDIETILDAAQTLRESSDIQWVLVGDGRMAPWIRDQVVARGLERTVTLPGSYPLEAMPALLRAADALLVTLKSDPIFALTIPGKVQAYLACGTPIVGALEGEGAKVLQESGAALVGPASDAGTLAANVLALHRMPRADRELMGKCGRRYYAEHFERESLIDQLERWFVESRSNAAA